MYGLFPLYASIGGFSWGARREVSLCREKRARGTRAARAGAAGNLRTGFFAADLFLATGRRVPTADVRRFATGFFRLTGAVLRFTRFTAALVRFAACFTVRLAPRLAARGLCRATVPFRRVTGFLRRATGFLRRATGFLRRATVFLRRATGFFRRAVFFAARFAGLFAARFAGRREERFTFRRAVFFGYRLAFRRVTFLRERFAFLRAVFFSGCFPFRRATLRGARFFRVPRVFAMPLSHFGLSLDMIDRVAAEFLGKHHYPDVTAVERVPPVGEQE